MVIPNDSKLCHLEANLPVKNVFILDWFWSAENVLDYTGKTSC